MSTRKPGYIVSQRTSLRDVIKEAIRDKWTGGKEKSKPLVTPSKASIKALEGQKKAMSLLERAS